MSENRETPHRLSRDEMKHNFVMSRVAHPAEEAEGAYRCHCVRCKWSFQVNPENGFIMALDEESRPLFGKEASSRIESFERELCPAFSARPEYREALGTHRGILAILHPVLHLLGLDYATQ